MAYLRKLDDTFLRFRGAGGSPGFLGVQWSIMNQTPKIEPVIYLLTGLLVFFTVAIFCAEWWFKSDGAFFQAIAAILGMIAGSLMTKVKTDHDSSNATLPGTTTEVHQLTKTPPDPPVLQEGPPSAS